MGLTQKLGTIPLAILTDSSNNVGIGAAANASYKLQVTGTTNLTGALSGTSATFSGDLTVDTNTLFVDSTNNNVGIGTGSPDANLEISQATDGATLRISSKQNNSSHVTTTPFGILEFFSSDASSPGASVRSSIGSYPQDTSASGGANLIFNNTNSSGSFEAMRITSSGNLGLGVTPSAWSLGKAIEIGNIGNSVWGVNATQFNVIQNAYHDAGGYKYASSNPASYYQQASGSHAWYTAPSGTVGNAISFTSAMTLFSTGNLGVGVGGTDSGFKLDVNGTGRFGGVASPRVYASGSGATGFPGYNLSNTTQEYEIIVRGNASNAFQIRNSTASTDLLTIASTGAATFSSTLTAGGGVNAGDSKFFNTVQLTDSLGGTCQGFLWTDAANTLKLGTGTVAGGNVKMTITSGGNVGIGTSSPKTYSSLTTSGQIISLGNIGIDINQSYRFNNYYNSGTVSDRTISTGFAASILLDNSVGAMTFNTSSSSVAADNNVSVTERMRITSGGYLKASNDGTYRGATDAYHEFVQTANDRNTIFRSTNASYTSNILLLDAVRSANSAYSFLFANSGDNTDREFDLKGDGNGYADGAWTGGGADYAEYFEWADGNINNEDRRGYSVSLVNNKIKIAEQGENIIGVISANPSIVGDAAWNKWNGKYLKDDFNSYILDEDGHRTLNPNYDEKAEYIPREQRPEWSVVGLMGKLRIRKGQATMPTWIKMRNVSENVEEWLIK